MSSKKSHFHQNCGQVDKINRGRLFNLFSLLAKNRFRWENLPNGIESRHVERYLFEYGQVAMLDDEQYGLVVLPSAETGQMNIYGDPTQFHVHGINYSKYVAVADLVRGLNNDHAVAGFLQVAHYTDVLERIEKIMAMNLNQQKFPFVIGTTKDTEMTMRKLYESFDEDEIAIFVDKRMQQGGEHQLEVMQTGAPYLLKHLQEHKNDVMNELLSWLGLNNTNNDKKERMLVSEVNVNNNHILMNLDVEYKNREKFAKEINEKFGLNVSVVKVIEELEVDFMGDMIEDTNTDKDNGEGWLK